MSHDEGRVLVLAATDPAAAALAAPLLGVGHDVRALADGPHAPARVEGFDPEVVVVDLVRDPGGEGVDPVLRSRDRWPRAALVGAVPVGDMEAIVDALRAGAETCIAKPVHEEAARIVVGRALRVCRERVAVDRLARRGGEGLDLAHAPEIIGRHPTMQALVKKVAQAAPTRATVLIQGETGTGKELIAAALHHNSRRADGPFVGLNCASLSSAVLESELFGHERGAFTGALARRPGRFRRAHGGTLFLDEVSEIPKDVQVKLLRFLQERAFEPVGSDETVHVDVRIIAATNRNLKALVEDGAFREDLYYRLNVIRLDVPPLRARPSDVLLLADHFVRRCAVEEDRDVAGLTADARDLLLRYPWPGNVRELQNVIEQAVIMAESSLIDVADLPVTAPPREAEAVRLLVPGVTLAELERYAILQTLDAVGGSTSKAASILGISRRTIQYRLSEWGLSSREKN